MTSKKLLPFLKSLRSARVRERNGRPLFGGHAEEAGAGLLEVADLRPTPAEDAGPVGEVARRDGPPLPGESGPQAAVLPLTLCRTLPQTWTPPTPGFGFGFQGTNAAVPNSRTFGAFDTPITHCC